MATSLADLRRIALVTIVLTVAVTALGVGQLKLNSHYTAYFDHDDPLLIAHQEISSLYSRHDAVFVVLQSDSSFLSSENYRLLEDVSAQLAAQPFTASTLSITELGIIGETLTEEGDFIPSLRQLEQEHRAIGLLLARNEMLAGIWVQVDLPDNDASTVLNAIDIVRQTVDSTIAGLPVSAHYTGTLALNEAYIEVVRHDLTRIVPLLLLVMILVVGLLMRSWQTVFTMLPVGICSVVAAFGVVGLFGVELAAIHSFIPVIILSISQAGCVHMALSYKYFRSSGVPAREAALAATEDNVLPMSLANGTTALGFLGLTLSPSPPIRVIGYLVATGIIISFVLCMTLLPVLQARFDRRKVDTDTRFVFLNRLAMHVSKHRTGIVAVFLFLALPAAWFASRNVISDNVFEYFVPSHVFYQDTQLIENHFGGANTVLYSVESGEDFGFFEAAAIEDLDNFTSWLDQQPEVNRVISIADAAALEEARQMNRLQQRLTFYRSRIEESGDGIPPLALAVSADYSSSVVTVYLKQLDSGNLIDFDRRVHAWAAVNLGGYALRSGGPTLMFANLGEQNIRGMLAALTIALFVAALVLGAVFRSVRIAWIGLICNMLPILFVYSVWAVLNGQISIGAAVVMGMILGIVLDDTIYLLTAYRRGHRRNLSHPIEYALQRVGPALVVTTITLGCGLSLGLLSEFGPIWSMSALSVTIIGTALLVDLLLLPALLPPNGIRRVRT